MSEIIILFYHKNKKFPIIWESLGEKQSTAFARIDIPQALSVQGLLAIDCFSLTI